MFGLKTGARRLRELEDELGRLKDAHIRLEKRLEDTEDHLARRLERFLKRVQRDEAQPPQELTEASGPAPQTRVDQLNAAILARRHRALQNGPR